MTNNLVETLLYKNEESAVSINVVIDQENETMWATQKTIAELFNVNVPAISKHLKNIFNEGELTKNSVISKMETTANDRKKYNTNFYNLDAIISVGYRVNSKEATQFRKWATKILMEYMVKGFALDTELLTEKLFGIDLDTVLTEEEGTIKTVDTAPSPTEEQLITIQKLNEDAIILATNFFDFVSSLLNEMITQETFSYSYPLFYNFILREIGLYINDLTRINEKTSIDPIFVLGYESRYSLSMKNIAQFIGGLADPSQEAIIQKAREFEQRFDELLDEYNNENIDPAFQNELSQIALATVQEFQDFLETIIQNILDKELYFIVEPLFWDNLYTFILYFNYLLQGVIYNVKKA